MKKIRVLVLESSLSVKEMLEKSFGDDTVELVILNSATRLKIESESSDFDLFFLDGIATEERGIFYAALIKAAFGEDKIFITTNSEETSKRFTKIGFQCCGKDKITGIISSHQ